MCVCVCVVSVIVKRPAFPSCAADGRSRNPLYYYHSIIAIDEIVGKLIMTLPIFVNITSDPNLLVGEINKELFNFDRDGLIFDP